MGVFDRVGIMGKDHSKVHEQTNLHLTYNVFLICIRLQLLTTTLDNASSNMTLCVTIEDIHLRQKLAPWWADENQLP